MQKMTGFRMIDCSTLPFLGWNFLDDERYIGKADEILLIILINI